MLQWRDLRQRLHSLLGLPPNAFQLLPMERGPLHDEAECPRRELPPHYTSILDSDVCLELRVLGVEVRRRMVVKVHVDGDAEELRDLGQAGARGGVEGSSANLASTGPPGARFPLLTGRPEASCAVAVGGHPEASRAT